ncbi:hypothetical protein LYNGBM3L_46500 [Moorena producens 3L]|uniref:Uncharacterized protein n=1 Tax=Moorena producens 3L TaxID=489825 RepID=F4XQE3_9CYAN|nr:hypothetical protein [Moorena producens]EGJ33186.1 hypothetical protein LYNGBM3L_46500 [Moorena producens 3L]OLT53582.1 hypothetical protein BI334_33045 [Moorena producens 3L]
MRSDNVSITPVYYGDELDLNKALKVVARDSIDIGNLTFNDLKLSSEFEVIVNDSIVVGGLKEEKLLELLKLKRLEIDNYTEIKFDTHLNDKFDYRVNEDGWSDANSYRGIYNALPFKIKPYKDGRKFKTQILFDDGDTISAAVLRDESTFISEFSKNEIHIYLIRIRQLSEKASWDTYDNFIQYQIVEFNGILGMK